MAIRLTSDGLQGLTYVNETKRYSGSSVSMSPISVWSIGYTKVYGSDDADMMTLKSPSSGIYYVLYVHGWRTYVSRDKFVSGGTNLVAGGSDSDSTSSDVTLFRIE